MKRFGLTLVTLCALAMPFKSASAQFPWPDSNWTLPDSLPWQFDSSFTFPDWGFPGDSIPFDCDFQFPGWFPGGIHLGPISITILLVCGDDTTTFCSGTVSIDSTGSYST